MESEHERVEKLKDFLLSILDKQQTRELNEWIKEQEITEQLNEQQRKDCL